MRKFRLRKGILYAGNDREITCWRLIRMFDGIVAGPSLCSVGCAAFRIEERKFDTDIERYACCLALPHERDGGPAILGVLDEEE